ncbi:DUF397 domain-containing protein [Streptomyces sp. NBRC 109706]|uniref:DUF397 domain-containing protein n=1 Tax=Streptomyces sp. NBRC 109706 TaxID=1550035 RepID=UPI0007830F07|nr:DUF397 domain-containing protein [Streptomyces sp. NBRC 109706]
MLEDNPTWIKSSYSGGNGNCVEVAILAARDTKNLWRKSSHSAGNGDCVEVAVVTDAGRAVRDSKKPGPQLAFGATQWTAFLRLAVGEGPVG